MILSRIMLQSAQQLRSRSACVCGPCPNWPYRHKLVLAPPLCEVAHSCEVCLIFWVVAFLYRITAAPVHLWAPDVYEGAPMVLDYSITGVRHDAAGGTLEALGVFDGHGGKGAGQYAAKQLIPALLSGLKEQPSNHGHQGRAA